MEKLHQELEKDGLVMVAVNFQEGLERVKEFFTQHNLHVYASPGSRRKSYRALSGLGSSGECRNEQERRNSSKAVGAKDWYSDEARQFFKKLLADD